VRHAVYPGTFDPFTPGHFDIADRARRLVERLTILVAVNPEKEPAASGESRALSVREKLPLNWGNVDVIAWAGLTVAFCRQSGAEVIVRGVRNQADLRHEYQLAAMNDHLGVPTLLIPARADLTRVSSTAARSEAAASETATASETAAGIEAAGERRRRPVDGRPEIG
jgi:pantetheine-phosphate adenylyltransferase